MEEEPRYNFNEDATCVWFQITLSNLIKAIPSLMNTYSDARALMLKEIKAKLEEAELWAHDYESVPEPEPHLLSGLKGYKGTSRLVCKRCGEISECVTAEFEYQIEVKE